MSTRSFFQDEDDARPRTADGNLRPTAVKRPTLGSRNVSFTLGVKELAAPKTPEHHRSNSASGTVDTQQAFSRRTGDRVQHVDRHAQNVDP
jgi:hypothetical protein